MDEARDRSAASDHLGQPDEDEVEPVSSSPSVSSPSLDDSSPVSLPSPSRTGHAGKHSNTVDTVMRRRIVVILL
jgi:hypothetical protein